jgi:PelA/Pel-15E family pectate lyase
MKSLPTVLCASLLGIALCGGSQAAVVGMSQPAQSITAERIGTLPVVQRAAWLDYLKRSEAQRAADKAALAAERKPGMPVPAPPAEDARHDGMPLDRDAAWYGTPEARHAADEIVSFQTPAGGWGKNQDRSGPLRLPGQAYVPNNISHYLAPGDFDTPKEADWNYVGTLDNNATTTELHFLALVAKATPGHDGDAYRDSFVRGIHYLLEAQFPNGGWPQVWPLEGGYHDAITYNDDAVTLAAALLTDVAENEDGDYNFISAALRGKAAAAAHHALDCILATQVKVDGHLTIWAQQHDALTLKPVAARNFEPAVLSSEESADLLVYLMSLPHPSAALQAAIHAGVAFLKKAAVYGYVYTSRNAPGGRHLVAQAGAGPIWARFYDGEPSRPVFGDRDKTIHDNVNELTLERRNGYSWYNADPKKALTAYDGWNKAHPPRKAH